ncbi:MAG: hypothetical protein ABIG46_00450 [Candidatus Omnitrophota bacterium]
MIADEKKQMSADTSDYICANLVAFICADLCKNCHAGIRIPV